MRNKIAIEEHFAIEDTLRESTEYALPGQFNTFERRMLDLDDERLTYRYAWHHMRLTDVNVVVHKAILA